MKKRDLILLTVLVLMGLAALTVALLQNHGKSAAGRLQVFVDGRLYTESPLEAGKTITIQQDNGSENVMNCDSVAMMCALYPEFVKNTLSTHASCITDEGETYSQVIFYKEGFTYDIAENDFDYDTVLVTEVDKSVYFDTYLEAIK